MSHIRDHVNGLQDLWSRSTGDRRICIAVLDGPVDRRHPCLAGAELTEVTTVAAGPAGDDPASRHGTHVASVIFGRHGSAVPGLAPGCRGLIVPIYSPRPGPLACSQLELARAIELAAAHGAHVINISGGELVDGGQAEPLLERAIRRCTESGILIVAAAGNDGCRCLHVPAAVSSVLAVGAMDGQGEPLGVSNWGDAYRKQGVLASGRNVPGAAPGGGTAEKTGTSFATPIVSGVAALLLSLQLRQSGRPDAHRVRTAILGSAEPCDPTTRKDCERMLAGRLDVPAALARLGLDLAPQAKAEMTNVARQRKVDVMDQDGQIISGAQPGVDSHENLAFEAGVAAERAEAGQVTASEVQPSDCGCGGTCGGGGEKNAEKSAGPGLVYALGQVGYDFGTEARRDSFAQQTGRNVYDPAVLLDYLEQDPAAAASLLWTLSIDTTVIYVVQPFGPYAPLAYERLREFLRAQLTDGVERISVPGYSKGSVRLLSGQTVPGLFPEIRGMYSWSTRALVKALGAAPSGKEAAAAHQRKSAGIESFLERIYYEVRNLGVTPQDRAINHAATNAFQIEFVFRDAIENQLKLDGIDVERSPIGRPGSDCWDVKLTFFNPARRLEQARHVYRFTVDVSDVLPVTIGKVRHWEIY